MTLRSFIFWCHLSAGVCAGSVILLMSATGVLLTYERQLLAWADSGYESVVPTGEAKRLPIESVLARLRVSHAGLQPATIAVRNDPRAPVVVSAGARTLYLDAYSGMILGEPSRAGLRGAMSTVREWHRWLALAGANRSTGRAITGWSTVIFAGIVCSGLFLWLPRRLTWQQVRSVAFLRPGLRGKARDFNWHNAIGVWSAIPLLLITLSALPISFSWANAAVYGIFGEQPPAAAAARPQSSGRDVRTDGLDRAFAHATQRVSGWRTVSVRLPAGAAGYVFTIDRGDGGQPQLKDTLSVAASGEVTFERFSDQTPGRRLRSISRFTHTGEVLGIPGQTVAGLASAGASVLVWTGLSLALRRLLTSRRAVDSDRREKTAA